ncbi:hypothetical protein [Sinomonas gamaensis]|uniref:hypothetical protein n=1 Tax=Sinomonas gamaensis TaxID=2565624 RepID=UPI001109F285|nr:hypothetical protein [Sinomonas gamaensis]
MDSIVNEIERWLDPRMEAHIKGQPLPPEPGFLARFRSDLEAAEEVQREEDEAYEEWMLEERGTTSS